MMKSVTIVGIGMGLGTTTREGFSAIEHAEALFGAPRMLEPFAFLSKPGAAIFTPDEISSFIMQSEFTRFAVLVSGDPGFFSAAEALTRLLPNCDVTLLPGISSVSCFFARIKHPWQDAALISCHGRDANLVDTVRRNRLTFALTGGNLPALAGRLIDKGYGDLQATIGENLGSTNEQIRTMAVADLPAQVFGALSVLFVENPDFDARVRSGLPDDLFLRGNIPMTKSEVRALSLSRLALRPDAVCYDIGCGTGSVSVEMALAAYAGHMYAIDHKEEAIRLTEENARRFHLGNLTTVCGSAPEALGSLPPPDAVFIGGSGGQMQEIFQAIVAKNPAVRVVVNAVALESVSAALSAFRAYHIEPEVVQLSVARANAVGDLHMMSAQNPIFVLSGGGHG